MLPQVEHLRVAAESARNKLDTAMAAVVAAEQKSPLVTPSTTAAGVAVPRVLVRGSEGTLLTHNTAAGGAGAGDGGSGGSGGSGGGVDAAVVSSASGGAEYGGGPELVAVPAAEERQEMYKREHAETGESLTGGRERVGDEWEGAMQVQVHNTANSDQNTQTHAPHLALSLLSCSSAPLNCPPQTPPLPPTKHPHKHT